jgi:hypothetical protein
MGRRRSTPRMETPLDYLLRKRELLPRWMRFVPRRLTEREEAVMREIVRLCIGTLRWKLVDMNWPQKGLAAVVARNLGCNPKLVERYLREPAFREEFWRRMGEPDYLLNRIEAGHRADAETRERAERLAEKLRRALRRAKPLK